MTLNILTSLLMLSCPFGDRVDLLGVYEYPMLRDQVEFMAKGKAVYTRLGMDPDYVNYYVNAITGKIVISRNGKQLSSLYVMNNALYLGDPRRTFDGGITLNQVNPSSDQSLSCIMSDTINRLFPSVIS